MLHFESIDLDDDLRLEVLSEEHADPLHELVEENRNYLARTLPWATETATPQDTRDFVVVRRRIFEHRRALPLLIRFRGELVGGIGMDVVDPETRCGELGYWLAEDRQGLGLMTRSASALLDVAFDQWRMHRIEILTTPQNTRSVAVAERLGFILEGTKRQAGRLDDEWIDLRLYSLLSEEWRRA